MNLLGPVTVRNDSGEVVLGAAKERSLLAVLALHPEEFVASEQLIDALWGEAPPATTRKTLQTYVSHLRRALGPNVVLTRAFGYALALDAEAVDVCRFRRLVQSGEEALRAEDPGHAASVARRRRRALAWRTLRRCRRAHGPRRRSGATP